MDPGFHGSLKTARPYTPLSDAERFEALTAGLEAASLHHVARHVREQRAELSIPSHAMYTQRLLAGRGDAFAPIYVTSPSMNGARRSTLNSVHAMPIATSSVKKSPATYSSPNLLRQFAELAAGCNTSDYASVSPPASNFYTYNMAVANSCTDTYL